MEISPIKALDFHRSENNENFFNNNTNSQDNRYENKCGKMLSYQDKLKKQISPLDTDNYPQRSKTLNQSKKKMIPSLSNRFSSVKDETKSKLIFETRYFEFFINNNEANKDNKLKDNTVTTTKYSVFTFLPKGLLLQFTRLSNIYFLFTAIIQSIPIISPLSSLTAIVPLIFVLGVSLIRELIEDFSRRNYDYLSNNEEVIVFRDNQFVRSQSKTLRTGELVIVYEDRIIPADMLLIDSGISEGKCYIETSSLDGEKALKLKFSNKVTNNFISNFCKGKNIEKDKSLKIEKLEGSGEVALPDSDLNHFEGKIEFISKVSKGENNFNEINEKFNVTIKEFLLKGSVLRNTNWIIGLIIYTGMNNKIILNSKKPRMKVSKIETNMNYYLIFVLFFLILCCLICSLMHNYGYKHNQDFYENFILLDQSPGLDNFLTFFTYFLLLNTMIPISLIVTIEIIKIIQGFLIEWDVKLYSKLKKSFCKARTVSINEELGNVNFIFSDKTGTLTLNQLKFKYCVINQNCYEYIRPNELNKPKNKRNSNDYEAQKKLKSKLLRDGINQITPFEDEFFYRFTNQKKHNRYEFSNKENGNSSSSDNNDKELEKITEFWKALSITNEVTIGEEKNEIKYIGTSPDDLELVKAAAAQGFKLINTSSEQKIIRIGHGGDDQIEFDVLNALNFSSERKRMSLIIRRKTDQKIIIYTKGADSEILKRLNKKNSVKDSTKFISNSIEIFSRYGFRTLLVAYREISEKEYKIWLDKIRIEEMKGGKHQLVEKYYDNIEKDFELLGGTVVEDKLQDEVPETIKDLRKAGIKIWVLTGDKLDTVENIGKSCNLITIEEKVFKVCVKDGNVERVKNDASEEIYRFMQSFQIYLEELQSKYKDNLDKNQNQNYALDNSKNEIDCSDRSIKVNWNLFYMLLDKKYIDPFCIIIESPILNGLFKDEELTEDFLKIANYASTVLCCRVSPFQKSQVVQKMKEFDKSIITLAIGDGGNDVSMIMEANIGIGIYGEEGTSAAQASDFAIGEFKLLKRLLFFHGRVNMTRISKMIIYFFYKNFIFTMVQFYYSLSNLSSGQTLIDDWFITCYNLVFTAFPLCVAALTDIDITEKDCKNLDQKLPFLYKENRDTNRYFTLPRFIITVIISVFFSGFIFILSVDRGIINHKGDQSNIWYMSLKDYLAILLVVSIHLLLTTKYIVYYLPLTILCLTFILAFLFFLFVHYGLIFEFNSKGTIFDSLSCAKLYIYLFLVSVFHLVVDYSIKIIEIFFQKSLISDLERKRIQKKISGLSGNNSLGQKGSKKSNKLSSNVNNNSQAKEILIHKNTLFKNKGNEENQIIRIAHKSIGGVRELSKIDSSKKYNNNNYSNSVPAGNKISPFRMINNNTNNNNVSFKHNEEEEENEDGEDNEDSNEEDEEN